jgi:hypothetical protein
MHICMQACKVQVVLVFLQEARKRLQLARRDSIESDSRGSVVLLCVVKVLMCGI